MCVVHFLQEEVARTTCWMIWEYFGTRYTIGSSYRVLCKFFIFFSYRLTSPIKLRAPYPHYSVLNIPWDHQLMYYVSGAWVSWMLKRKCCHADWLTARGNIVVKRDYCCWPPLTSTHPPLDKMAAISQTIFSDAFSRMKSYVFWLKFHWSLFVRV